MDADGWVTTEWELTPEERQVILEGGRLRLVQLTHPEADARVFQPVMLTVVPLTEALPLEPAM